MARCRPEQSQSAACHPVMNEQRSADLMGVDEDKKVALAGIRGYEAPEVIRVDKVTGGAVPYSK